ncbi:unnamed protein product, partial [Polarella glacialis]
VLCTQLREVDFQPPKVEPPRYKVALGEASIEVSGHEDGGKEQYRELWARVGATSTDVVALELQSEVPAPKAARSGLWIFSGKRFARVLTPCRGTALVAGTCCQSLSQLQKLRGKSE